LRFKNDLRSRLYIDAQLMSGEEPNSTIFTRSAVKILFMTFPK